MLIKIKGIIFFEQVMQNKYRFRLFSLKISFRFSNGKMIHTSTSAKAALSLLSSEEYPIKY